MKKTLFYLLLLLFYITGCSFKNEPQKIGNGKKLNTKWNSGFNAGYLISNNYTIYTNQKNTKILLCSNHYKKSDWFKAIYIEKKQNNWFVSYPEEKYACNERNLSKLIKKGKTYVWSDHFSSYSAMDIIYLSEPYLRLKLHNETEHYRNTKDLIFGTKHFELILIPNINSFDCNKSDDKIFKKLYSQYQEDYFKTSLLKLAKNYQNKCNRVLTPIIHLHKKANLEKYLKYFPDNCTSIDINGRKFHNITWTGKFNKMAEPIGKGCLKCTITAPLSFPRYYTICTIIKNGKIADNGTLYAEITGTKRNAPYNKNTNIEVALFKLMEGNVEQHNRYWAGTWTEIKDSVVNSLANNSSEQLSCKNAYNKCLKYCDNKSSQGFLFNDKKMCETACSLGKDECKKGNKNKAKLYMCKGICKGVNESNGGFFGSSDYDKCVNNCINSGEF